MVTAVLFVLAFSRLHVECAYSAILKWRDKSYWEEYDAPAPLTDKEKKRIVWVLVTILELIIVFCLGLFSEELLKMGRLVIRVTGGIMVGIFADWIIRLARWMYKKNKKEPDDTGTKNF